MFTGIIEQMGEVEYILPEGGNLTFTFRAEMTSQLHPDQSLSHNGVCLTVIDLPHTGLYRVTAIAETLSKTNLGSLRVGNKVNLERCMPAQGRFDGHIVQGHVDQTGVCTQVREENGSWRFWFEYDPSEGHLTVSKGSIAINGVSSTVVDSFEKGFSVAIIPYTYQHTTFGLLREGEQVNLEFDIVGKYLQKLMAFHQGA
jgi:riboflavin synthase